MSLMVKTVKFFKKLKQFLSFHFLIRYKLNRFVKSEIQCKIYNYD